MKSCVLILSGLPGSGKSEAAEYFSKKNFPVIRMGTLTDNLLQKGKHQGERQEKAIRENVRKQFGNDIYAKWAIEELNQLNKENNIIVVDGLRNTAELEYFNNHLPSIKLVYIETRQEIRYARLANRTIRPLTENEAQRRDVAELYILGLNEVKQRADYTIVNDQSIEKLHIQLEKIINQIR